MNRAVALEALRKANEVFGRLQLRFWLDCGSLLGAVRHSDIMEHDLDVDFSSWDWQRHEEIRRAMAEAGFEFLRSYGEPRRGFEQAFGWKGAKVDLFYFYEGTQHGPRPGVCWQGSWDRERLIESRFPKDIVKDTVPLTIKGITVPVPVEYEAMLVARYNDWLTPVKKWNWRTDPYCIVEPMDLTFLIKTFMRPDIAERAVRSVRDMYPDTQVLVVDDSDISEMAERRLRELGADVLRIPYDSGLSAGRNAGVKNITTRYTFVMDDDMVVTKATDIPAMLSLLEGADVVCGAVMQDGKLLRWEGLYDFPPDGGVVLRRIKSPFQTEGGVRFASVDFGLNVMVAETRLLRAHPWDERLKLHEHTDWFLGLRGKAKVRFTPDSVFDHRRQMEGEYQHFRFRKEFRLVFFKKHGFAYHVGLSGYRDEWTPQDEDTYNRFLRGGQMSRLKRYTFTDERGNQVTLKLTEESAREMGVFAESTPKVPAKKRTTAKNKKQTTARTKR